MYSKQLGRRLGKRIKSGLSAALKAKFLYLWTGRYGGDNLLNNLGTDEITVLNKWWNSIYIPPRRLQSPLEVIKYGFLYNYYAVIDARQLLADGWKIPGDYMRIGGASEWKILSDYLSTSPGVKLKYEGFEYWTDSGNLTTIGSNESEFNATGGGIRHYTNGLFSLLKNNSYYWCGDYPNAVILSYNLSNFNIVGGGYEGYTRSYGFSVRPVKVTTSLADGETGTYTGNDGKIYRTICIGTQEWLADNLAETKYRNGDDIPEVTNNSTWVNLVSGARCAYNNDFSNVLILDPSFSVPNNSEYISADGIDDFWFDASNVLQQKTHTELIESTTSRTFVYYSDEEPYNIHAIGILKDGETLSESEQISLTKYFKLWVQYWSTTMLEQGHLKTNRTLIED